MPSWLLFLFSKPGNAIISSILIAIFKFPKNYFSLSTPPNLHRFAHPIGLPKDLEKDRIWGFQIENELSFFH